ncbi:DUF2231 domain-containing protein [Acrocarpospora macrocephala]|uniref:DUF2231 domain-containing protein n=1 Tax=Acrocarpospora macrocephala TaxID=150177 RepID=A0A5M3X0R4_9ACTN|nr:DUF2231 domain-containing protein [Acrocarpospora macrocephala]GES15337.1 hypothetical protein Amac_089340 [Acrocarpospora macrocephala]
MSTPPRRAKEPVTVLAGPYGHPLHPILVTVPIGAWVSSLIFDLGSHLVREPGFLTEGSIWLIAVGVIGALVAAMFGFLDLLAIPGGTPAFRTGLVHMGVNVAVITAYAVAWAWRLAGDGLAAVGAGQIALSAISLAGLAVSGFLGGKLAFRYGVRVADEVTQARGFDLNS